MTNAVSLAISDSRDLNNPCLELTSKIKAALYDIANSFVYIGFLLAECQDYQTYKDWGYNSIYDYAFDQFGFKKSSVNNFINVCKTFSSNFSSCGEPLPYSMIMKDDYKSFKYSQLVEMLSMNDKQRSQVTSDMTVKDIRALKKSVDVVDIPPASSSRRLEEVPAPEVPVASVSSDVDYLIPHEADLRILFDDIDDAYLLNDVYDGMDLFDVVQDFFNDKGYIILQKAK